MVVPAVASLQLQDPLREAPGAWRSLHTQVFTAFHCFQVEAELHLVQYRDSALTDPLLYLVILLHS